MHLYAPIQKIEDPLLTDCGINLLIKREDLIHPHISGNKWRKLKYNLTEAANQKKDTILTFGGAYSNHIAAAAAAGKAFGIKTIGVIRGEEHLPLNPTLQFAAECGMKFHYMNREAYRQKDKTEITDKLREMYGDFYLVPEGGANAEGVKGCAEILKELEQHFDYVCCPCGTGATLAGISSSLKEDQQALGFAVLKGASFLEREVEALIASAFPKDQAGKWSIVHDYHFGGYAKFNDELVSFIRSFRNRSHIPLDPIYTGKMVFGIYDLIRKGFFQKGKTILLIHTGGLQGNRGFEQRYGIKLQQ